MSYKEVKEGVDKALFSLFREECGFLHRFEIPNISVPPECEHPKNKFAEEMTWKKDGVVQKQLPNCTYQSCPIYKVNTPVPGRPKK